MVRNHLQYYTCSAHPIRLGSHSNTLAPPARPIIRSSQEDQRVNPSRTDVRAHRRPKPGCARTTQHTRTEILIIITSARVAHSHVRARAHVSEKVDVPLVYSRLRPAQISSGRHSDGRYDGDGMSAQKPKRQYGSSAPRRVCDMKGSSSSGSRH